MLAATGGGKGDPAGRGWSWRNRDEVDILNCIRQSPEEVAMQGPLAREQLSRMDAWWRAANYLSVGQIYLFDNPLLGEPLSLRHIKPRLLGHWGTTPGLNFIYVHLNRVIRERDLNMVCVCGPG